MTELSRIAQPHSAPPPASPQRNLDPDIREKAKQILAIFRAAHEKLNQAKTNYHKYCLQGIPVPDPLKADINDYKRVYKAAQEGYKTAQFLLRNVHKEINNH